MLAVEFTVAMDNLIEAVCVLRRENNSVRVARVEHLEGAINHYEQCLRFFDDKDLDIAQKTELQSFIFSYIHCGKLHEKLLKMKNTILLLKAVVPQFHTSLIDDASNVVFLRVHDHPLQVMDDGAMAIAPELLEELSPCDANEEESLCSEDTPEDDVFMYPTPIHALPEGVSSSLLLSILQDARFQLFCSILLLASASGLAMATYGIGAFLLPFTSVLTTSIAVGGSGVLSSAFSYFFKTKPSDIVVENRFGDVEMVTLGMSE